MNVQVPCIETISNHKREQINRSSGTLSIRRPLRYLVSFIFNEPITVLRLCNVPILKWYWKLVGRLEIRIQVATRITSSSKHTSTAGRNRQTSIKFGLITSNSIQNYTRANHLALKGVRSWWVSCVWVPIPSTIAGIAAQTWTHSESAVFSVRYRLRDLYAFLMLQTLQKTRCSSFS